MARYKRLETLVRMKEVGLVPIFYQGDLEIARSVVAACADGGARVVEFTNRGDRAIQVFTQIEEWCAVNRPEVILGAGSIIDAPTAALYIAAGANFIVSPLMDEDSAILCNARKIPYVPGCATVTEIHRAHRLGVEFCKIFPAGEIGGPGFVKSVQGPCPWTEFMITGGVAPTRESLGAWFGAGIACAGMGSNLITADLLAKKDFAGIAAKVKAALAIVAEVRRGPG